MSGIAGAAAAVALSATLAGALLVAIGVRARGWLLLLLGLLPPVFLYLWNSNLRVFSFHGLLHTSIVYEIMSGHVPPECPVLAGEPLLYPWAHHLLVAGVSSAFRVSPFTVFASLNVACLALTLILMFKVTGFLSSNRNAQVFGAALSVFGLTFLSYGPLSTHLEQITHLPFFGLRIVLPAQKFTTVQSMPLGFACFALFLYSALHIFSTPKCRRRHYGTLFLAILGSGLFYPIVWLAALACGSAICTVAYRRHGRSSLPKVFRAALCIGCGSLLTLPYLYQVSAAKSEQMFELLPDSFVLVKAVGYLLTVLPALLILLWTHRELAEDLGERADALWLVVVTVATTALIYVFIATSWNTNEYKFLALSILSFGPLVAVGMEYVRRRSWVLCFLITVLFFLDISGHWLRKADLRGWRVSDPYVERGVHLRHADPNEAALYRWIQSRTDRDAIFIDTRLTVPVFGQRQLYVGFDRRRKHLKPAFLRDGWHMTVQEMLGPFWSYPPEMVEERIETAQRIYARGGGQIEEQVISALHRARGERDVYIITRHVAEAEKFADSVAFEKVFERAETAVYELRQPGSSAAAGR